MPEPVSLSVAIASLATAAGGVLAKWGDVSAIKARLKAVEEFGTELREDLDRLAGRVAHPRSPTGSRPSIVPEHDPRDMLRRIVALETARAEAERREEERDRADQAERVRMAASSATVQAVVESIKERLRERRGGGDGNRGSGYG